MNQRAVLFYALVALLLSACHNAPPSAQHTAEKNCTEHLGISFLRHCQTWASTHEGQRKADLGDGTYLNPIVAGDRPDPSILKDGKDYYMVFTTLDRKSVV